MEHTSGEKLAVIGEKVEKIEKWVDNADVNHFPTIERRFDAQDKQLNRWGGALTVLIIILGTMPWVLRLFHVF